LRPAAAVAAVGDCDRADDDGQHRRQGGRTDLQNNAAYHSAEGGIEKMTADLAATFQNALAPTASQICKPETMQRRWRSLTWKDYTVNARTGGADLPGTLITQFGQISSGPNQVCGPDHSGEHAGDRGDRAGKEVSMTRSAQVALFRCSQFGVFSESDLSFFSGPQF